MTIATGKLIVVEGLEGAGKSTAIITITDLLKQQGYTVLQVREPGGTAIGEQLRAIIKNTDYKEVLTDKTELLLMYAARLQLLQEVIKPALQQGHWVVADRFELSSFAYQGGGRGLDKNLIQQLSTFCLQGFQPDLILYLDLQPELGMQRVIRRGKPIELSNKKSIFFNVFMPPI